VWKRKKRLAFKGILKIYARVRSSMIWGWATHVTCEGILSERFQDQKPIFSLKSRSRSSMSETSLSLLRGDTQYLLLSLQSNGVWPLLPKSTGSATPSKRLGASGRTISRHTINWQRQKCATSGDECTQRVSSIRTCAWRARRLMPRDVRDAAWLN